MNTDQSLYERIGGHDGLALLLRHFYSDVRQHALIGPIFNRQIDDWPAHLEKIGSFWARLTGGPSGYSGQPPDKKHCKRRCPAISLITLDLDLPDISGFEVCRRLKENPFFHTPIVFVSGRPTEENQQRSHELGALDFIAKPFGADEFVRRLLSHIE